MDIGSWISSSISSKCYILVMIRPHSSSTYQYRPDSLPKSLRSFPIPFTPALTRRRRPNKHPLSTSSDPSPTRAASDNRIHEQNHASGSVPCIPSAHSFFS